jgi:Lipase (class 3)
MNMIGRFIAARLFLLWLVLRNELLRFVGGQPVLDYEYMLSTKVATDLAVRLYFGDESNDKDKYDAIKSYRDDPDGAMLAIRNGKCYVGFQGLDVFNPQAVARENTLPGVREVCPNGLEAECCTMRAVIWDTYYTTTYRLELERDIRSCVSSNCTDPDDCLYLTGYSSGGGTAILAAILHQDLKPNVITFGTAKALNPECPYTNPKRWVGWANSRKNDARTGLEYDEYPWRQSKDGLETFGYMLVISDDTSGVANFGFTNNRDRQGKVLSGPWDPINLFRTHRMTELLYKAPGYANRIDALRRRRRSDYPNGAF